MKKNARIIISIILAGIGVLCFLAAIILGIILNLEDLHARNTLDDLRASASAGPSGASPSDSTPSGSNSSGVSPADSAPSGSSTAPTPEPTPVPTPEPKQNPYRDSFLANSDMAAWLQIPGTIIDYPVMWTPRDEEYYLRRGFDGSSDSNGCLILDTDSCLDPLTTNLIIHGHNMSSGTMFGTLANYEREDFYQEHKTMTLYTPTLQRNYEVIAVFRSQVYKKSDQVFKFYKFFQADTQEEFDDFYNNIKEMSLYDTGVTAQFGDHFLTLSTCSYHVATGRFVVVAKETESGDSYLPPSP